MKEPNIEQINILKNLTEQFEKIKASVTLKMHCIFLHIKQFLEYQKETNNFDYGVGFYNEQR